MDQLQDDISSLHEQIMTHFAGEGNESLSEFSHAFDEVYYDERDSNWNDLANLTALHKVMRLIFEELVPNPSRTSAKLSKLCERGSTDVDVKRILDKICKFKVQAGLAAIKNAIAKTKAKRIADAERFERMRIAQLQAENTQAQADAIEAAAAQAAAARTAEEAEVRRQAEAVFSSPDEARRYLDLLAERDRRFQGGKKRSHNKGGNKSGKKSAKKGGKKSAKKGGKKSHAKKGGKKSHKKSHRRRH
jgi:hypothetical protein